MKKTDRVYLLPCGIRPVKDPFYLIDLFNEWFESVQNVYLIIVGPVLDENYFKKLELKIDKSRSVMYHDRISQIDLYFSMLECNGIVNTSESEGLSNTILESMYLRVPVLARNIEGNSNIISHCHSGLLFDSPTEFQTLADMLENSLDLRTTITETAYRYVRTNHSFANESNNYLHILKTYCIFPPMNKEF